MTEPKPRLIPNTFQCFNDHVDVAMELLTGDEYKVLNFATRHILGWQDSLVERQKRISLTMFEHGFVTKDGRRFAGTGIGRKTLIRILEFMTGCALLVAVGEPTDDGQLWELGESPDWSILLERERQKQEANQKRTAAAREKSLAIRNAGVSHTPENGVSDTPEISDEECVAHTIDQCVAHTDGGAVGHTESNPIQNPPQNPIAAAEIPALTVIPVESANNTPMLLLEMVPLPNASKKSKSNAKTPTPKPSATPSPSEDDFNIVELYRNTFGKVPSLTLKTVLYDAAQTYPREWVIDVFNEAAMNEAKTWKYCDTILKRWKQEGKTDTPAAAKSGAHQPAPLPVKPIPAGVFRPALSRGNENGSAN